MTLSTESKFLFLSNEVNWGALSNYGLVAVANVVKMGAVSHQLSAWLKATSGGEEIIIASARTVYI